MLSATHRNQPQGTVGSTDNTDSDWTLNLAICASDSTSLELEALVASIPALRLLRFDGLEELAPHSARHLDAIFIDADHYATLRVQDLPHCIAEAPLVVMAQRADWAAKAYDLQALDFLLKPLGAARFEETIRRIYAHRALRSAQLSEPVRTRIPLEVGRNTEFVDLEKIDYLSVHSNYVSVFVNRREFVTRNTLETMQANLDPARFVRVHRSFVVQIDAVQKVQKLGSDRFALHLRSGDRICTSRSARDVVRRSLGLAA
jgi:two-component system, LytTR family, response regulator